MNKEKEDSKYLSKIVGKASKTNNSNNNMIDLKIKRSMSNMSDYKQIGKEKINQDFESICSIEYDCTITENSSLFIPNVDFSKHGVNLLTQREVREISELDDLVLN